eukprot:7383486-Prymnesium_polylepis.4
MSSTASAVPAVALIARSLPDDTAAAALEAQCPRAAAIHVVPPGDLSLGALRTGVPQIEHVATAVRPAGLDEHIKIAPVGSARPGAAGRCAACSARPAVVAVTRGPSGGREVGLEAVKHGSRAGGGHDGGAHEKHHRSPCSHARKAAWCGARAAP